MWFKTGHIICKVIQIIINRANCLFIGLDLNFAALRVNIIFTNGASYVKICLKIDPSGTIFHIICIDEIFYFDADNGADVLQSRHADQIVENSDGKLKYILANSLSRFNFFKNFNKKVKLGPINSSTLHCYFAPLARYLQMQILSFCH